MYEDELKKIRKDIRKIQVSVNAKHLENLTNENINLQLKNIELIHTLKDVRKAHEEMCNLTMRLRQFYNNIPNEYKPKGDLV